MFADDILVIAKNLNTLKPIIKAIDKWCNINQMTVNKSKCTIMKVKKRETN